MPSTVLALAVGNGPSRSMSLDYDISRRKSVGGQSVIGPFHVVCLLFPRILLLVFEQLHPGQPRFICQTGFHGYLVTPGLAQLFLAGDAAAFSGFCGRDWWFHIRFRMSGELAVLARLMQQRVSDW